jgi:hypothetical protein
MRMREGCSVACAALVLAAIGMPSTSLADEFDRLEGRILADALKVAQRIGPGELTAVKAAQIPRVLGGVRSTLLVIKTDSGALARLLFDFGFRKPADAEAAAVPILILERFDTFEAGSAGARIARGEGVQLFDGFALDFDTGQIVPDGHGADIRFRGEGEAGPRIEFRGGAEAYALARSPFTEEHKSIRPSPGRAIVPADFAGRFHAALGGQWSGPLELNVGEDSTVTGRFRSEQTGSVYPVAGNVARPREGAIDLRIRFPRSEVILKGWLFAGGKNAIAGHGTFLDRPIGFFAVREDGMEAGQGIVVAGRGEGAQADRLVLDVSSDGSVRGSRGLLDDDALAAELLGAAREGEAPVVLVRAARDTPYESIVALIEKLHELNAAEIRLAPAGSPVP